MSIRSEQREQLLRPLNKRRVHQTPKGYSHVEAYDIRAMLIRIFDFGGWSQEVTAMELAFEDVDRDRPVMKYNKDTKRKEPTGEVYDAWTVAYRAQVRLTIHDTGAVYTEWAAGSASNYPSRSDAHDNAMKTAESQALKRCAANLGDQFGLGLYNAGSLAPLVKQIIAHDTVAAAQGVDDHVEELAPEVEESTYVENPPEPAPDPREHNAPQPAADDGAKRDEELLNLIRIVEEGPQGSESLVRWHAKMLATATAKRLLNEPAPGGVSVKTFIDLERDKRKGQS